MSPPPPTQPFHSLCLSNACSVSLPLCGFSHCQFCSSISFTQHLFLCFSFSLILLPSLSLSFSFSHPPPPQSPFSFLPSLSFLLFPSFSLSPQGQTDSHIILDVYRLGVVTVHSVYKVAMGPIVVNIIVICVYVYELARLYAICAHTCVCQPFWLHGYYTQTL